MADPEHWKRKINEIEAQKTQASDLVKKRHVHLLTELAGFESGVAAELAEFERSEEARTSPCMAAGWKLYFGAIFTSSQCLVTHNVFVHDHDERVYAFSGIGLSEFHRSVSFFLGLSVPARSWAYGDGMTGESVSAAQFASSYVRALFPQGPDSVTIPTYRDEDRQHYEKANDPRWDSIGLENWVQRLPNLKTSGIVDSIRQKFSLYLQSR